MKTTYYIVCIILIALLGCKGKSSSESKQNYSNGIYCAKVKYYYPKTGTRSTYRLKVEVKKKKLTKIYWSNGGWLDSSHFTPPAIKKGVAHFTTKEKKQYTVTIVDEKECKSRTSMVEDEDDEDEICPECGEEKDSWNEYCEDCLSRMCSECGCIGLFIK